MSSPTVAAPETVVKAEIPEPAAPAADMASTKPKKVKFKKDILTQNFGEMERIFKIVVLTIRPKSQ